MTPDEVPSGARVFLDSTIFIYHATAASEQCRALLERCERGDVVGVTSVVVLAEVAHRLMLIEAVGKGKVSAKDVVKKLRARPDIVRGLHMYLAHVERVPLMGVDVRPLEHRTFLRSADIRNRYGLLVNDSLVAAAAQEAAIEHLASADGDFSRIPSLTLYQPDDLP